MVTAAVAEGQMAHLAKKAIDARQAVRIAERFVRENGYTDFVPDDPSQLVPESVEFSRDRRDWLKNRQSTLKPKAVGYLKDSGSKSKGWIVGFALVKPRNSTRPVGRAVTMDARGHNVRVEHKGFLLDGLEPRAE
jgi:hypothetical protein